jgi:hypothetical protein
LRLTIDCLPVRTREAMLEGLERNDIIVGAYTSRDGGVCPMLAAHRSGGRTNLLSFARAWDRFAHAGRRPRRATERELGILRFELECSLMAVERVDLGAAIAEHRKRLARSDQPAGLHARSGEHRRRPAGDADRTGELRGRAGWAWLRPQRRLDDYERALERLEEGLGELAPVARSSAGEADRQALPV